MDWGIPTLRRKPVRVREGLRLSPNEERYVLAETTTGQVYSAPSATRIKGAAPAEYSTVLAALQATCDRHEARRTGYERGPDGRFTKYVHDRATVRLKRMKMPADATDEQILAAVNAYCLRRGDLSPGELHRFILIELSEDEHVFGMTLHHATSDGVTGAAFGMELFARALGLPVEGAPAQYSDFWDHDWTATEAYAKAREFWLDRVATIGEGAAWPADRTDPPSPVRLGQTLPLSPEQVAATKAAAAQIGVTHFSYYYAVYMALLSRLTGPRAVCTTFQSAGRRAFKGSESAHGVFSNALLLASEIDERESIAALAQRLRGEVREAIAHEIYPLHHLIRATGVHPRYAINWLPAGQRVTLEGVAFTPVGSPQNQDDDDLNLRFVTLGEEVWLTLYYDPAQFSADRVAATARQMADLAAAFARDVNRPIGEVLASTFAAPGVLPDPAAPLAAGKPETIFARFLEQAQERPQALAIEAGGRRLTYGELEARSRALAQRLAQAGVRAGDRVAILADRGPELVWSMLAAARLGAAFVVLDSAYPEPRLASYLAIAAPHAVLRAGAAALRPLAERLALEAGAPVVDADAGKAPAPGEALDRAHPDDPAYFLFTSGSTGHPKCVACTHRPLANFVRWQAAEYGLTAQDRFTLLSGLSHDPLLRDVFTPLSIGATVVIPQGAIVTEPDRLGRWVAEAQATVAHLTPPLGRVLMAGANGLPGLKRIFWGGDRLPAATIEALHRLAPQAEQVNFYGATETPQAAGAFDIPTEGIDRAIAPLGRGAAGAQLLVLDAAGRPAGIGELGRIGVRSRLLPLGQVEAGRIVAPTDRVQDAQGQPTICLTGDQGFYLPDGAVYFVGRSDDQVKVRGHRVHLAEVAAQLEAQAGVREAVALPVGEGAETAIAAFVAGRGSATSEAELLTALAARLPAHMIPQRLRCLEDLPRLPNGKPDRQTLLKLLDETRAAPKRPSAPANPLERQLIERWSDVLGITTISRDSTFARLGGDSLSYVQGYLAVEEAVGAAPEDWPHRTIAELAGMAATPSSASTVDAPILVRAAAITAVVAAHFGLIGYGFAATGGLFLVSGFLLGELAINETFASRTAAPLLRSLIKLFVPTAVITLALYLFRLPGHPPDPYILLFSADLQNYNQTHHAQDLPLWFVDALLHILGFVWLAALGVKALKRFDIGPARFLGGLFVVGCLGRFVLPLLLDPGFFRFGAQHPLWIQYLPTTHLATIAMGGLLAYARGSRRWTALGLVIAYSAATAWCYGPGHTPFILAAGLALLFLPQLRLPKFVGSAALAVAGASLWIYLTHMGLRDGLGHLGLHPPPVLMVVAGLGAGVAIWKAWRWLNRTLRLLWGQAAPAPAIEASL
jgi:amino acid adenylation domain-containing protein